MSERRPHKPTTRGVGKHDDEMTVPERVGARKPPTKPPPIPQMAAKTIVDPPRIEKPVFIATSAAPKPAEPGSKSASASQPLRVISMKTPAEIAAERKGEPKVVQVDPRRMQLREMRPRHATPPQGLGRLAPPRDEREHRVRRRQDLLIWGSIIVIVGSFVTLGIWFIAR